VRAVDRRFRADVGFLDSDGCGAGESGVAAAALPPRKTLMDYAPSIQTAQFYLNRYNESERAVAETGAHRRT
jgi:hypothetical protein